MLDYKKLPFELRTHLDLPSSRKGAGEPARYICSEELRLALDVALVTRRPLLLSGEPGTGKSSFGRWVAANLGWRFYKFVVTSHSRPRDLLYQWDAVRRLSDAQGQRVETGQDHLYVEPGPLWWAIDAQSAAKRGSPSAGGRAQDPGENWPRPPRTSAEVPRDGAVLLIDEIDKAEVDFPNDLLDPLDRYEFLLTELGGSVIQLPRDADTTQMPKLLVVITTNKERDLPPAFVRRCTVWELEMPEKSDLLKIAREHFGDSKTDLPLYDGVARVLFGLRGEAAREGLRPPATAEYLDAIRACRDLGIRPPAEGQEPAPAWKFVQQLMLTKKAASGP
jgi:MoxR-like ATPase